MRKALFYIAVVVAVVLGSTTRARAVTAQDVCVASAEREGNQFLASYAAHYGVSNCGILSYHIEYAAGATNCFDQTVVLHVYCSNGGQHSLGAPVCETSPGCPVGQLMFYGLPDNHLNQ